MDLLEEFGDVVVFLHFLTFTVIMFIIAYFLHIEYDRAKESWIRASERLKSEEDKHSWEVGDINVSKAHSLSIGQEKISQNQLPN